MFGKETRKGQICACSTIKSKPSYCEYPSVLSGIERKYAKFIFSVIYYYHFLHAVHEAFSHKKGLALTFSELSAQSTSQNNRILMSEGIRVGEHHSLLFFPKRCLIHFLSAPELKGKSSLGSAGIVNVTQMV